MGATVKKGLQPWIMMDMDMGKINSVLQPLSTMDKPKTMPNYHNIKVKEVHSTRSELKATTPKGSIVMTKALITIQLVAIQGLILIGSLN